MRYLSDSDPHYRLLEDFIAQGNLGDLPDLAMVERERSSEINSGNVIRLGDSENDLSEAAELARQLNDVRSRLPTRYDSPSQYLILEGLTNEILRSAQVLRVEINPVPRIATVPTGNVNACAIRFNANAPIFLLFDSQTFTFLHLFAKAITLFVPLESYKFGIAEHSLRAEDIDSHIKTNGSVSVQRMVQLMKAWIHDRRPMSAESYRPDKHNCGMIAALRDGMELFLVGHEIGHFVRGHLGKSLGKHFWSALDSSEIQKNHRFEHEADLVGVELAHNALRHRGYDDNFAYIGCDLFFSSLLLAFRLESWYLNRLDPGWQDPESESHPSLYKRRRIIRKYITSKCRDQMYNSGPNQFISFFDRLFYVIWPLIQTSMEAKGLTSSNDKQV